MNKSDTKREQLPHLTLVTFSGAHATGKTTLMADLRDCLKRREDTSVSAVESCSSHLFEMIRAGKVQLPRGMQPPKNYDDINKNGLRPFFQQRLPDALAFQVETSVLRALDDLPLQPHTYLLVDRWFTDIYAFTEIESEDEKLHEQVRQLCVAHVKDLQSWLLRHVRLLSIVNVFIPVASCNFPVPKTKKFRATCDRSKWETICLSRWKSVAETRRGILVISETDRVRRVEQIVSTLDTGKPEHTHKSTS